MLTVKCVKDGRVRWIREVKTEVEATTAYATYSLPRGVSFAGVAREASWSLERCNVTSSTFDDE
jgi:hypothetical protein